MHEKPRRGRAGEPTGTAEAKAIGREIFELGGRCLRAGLGWLNRGRDEMTNERNDDDRGGRQDHGEGEQRRRQERPSEDDIGRTGGPDPEDRSDRGRRRREDPDFERRTGYAQRGYDDSWDQREREATGGGEGVRGMPIAGGIGLGRGGYAGNYQSAEPGSGLGRGGDEYDVRFGRYPEPRWGDRHRGEDRYGSAPGGGVAGRGRGHRGRGPRGYTRSDERIAEEVCERLMDDDDVDASDISVDVREGVVTLTGNVDERWAKHRAEDIADACVGVTDVENRLRVSGRGRRGGDSAPEDGEGHDVAGR